MSRNIGAGLSAGAAVVLERKKPKLFFLAERFLFEKFEQDDFGETDGDDK